MTKEKLYQWIIPGLILIVLVGLIIYEQSKQKVDALGQFSVNKIIINGNANRDVLSSFTLLLPNATTSYKFGINRADSVDLNFAFHSTSTPVTLTWFYEFSDDNANFYREDINSTSGAIVTHVGGTASSSPTLHQWVPVTATSTVNKNIHVNQSGIPLGSKYMRISLSCWVQTATTNENCLWWGEAILRQPF